MPTLQEYRQALASARDMGGYIPFTATSTSATSTATQEILSTAFLDDTPNIASRYAGAWVLGVTGGTSAALAGIQRQLRPYGLDATTGTLYTTRAFGSTPQSGHKWELYFRIPPIRDDATGRDGYRELINEALRLMAVPDRIAISGVTDQTRYTLNLTMYPWLRDRNRILHVWAPTPRTTDLERLDGQAWRILPDGETVVLQIPQSYATGEAFKLEVLRPANSRLRVGGVWQDQTSVLAGLTSDSDEAIPPISELLAVARELAFAELMRGAPEAEARFWEGKRAAAELEASAVKFSTTTPQERSPSPQYSGWGDLAAWR